MRAIEQRVKLKATVPKDVRMTRGLVFADTSETYGLEIHDGRCEVHPSLPQTTHATVVTQRGVVDRILLRETTVSEALEDGSLRVAGRTDNVTKFFGCFDAPVPRFPSC